jgi:hypothetical protein
VSELATTSQALSTLSQDELAQLEADRQKMGGSRVPTIPQIRLSNKDMTAAPEGEYFIEVYKGKDEESEIRELGPNPEITILYKTATYSYYTKEDGLMAWTSDIHGFTSLDRVTLFVKREGKVVIEKDANYPEFKQYVGQRFVTTDPVTGKPKKLLKFKTVLYVLHEGQPYKMFVSNASSAGVDAEGLPSFDAPQPTSLQAFTDSCWQAKRALYEFSVRLGSQYVTSDADDETPGKLLAKVPKPFYVMTFERAGDLDADSLRTALRASKQAEAAIHAIDESRRVVEAPETKEDLPDFDVEVVHEPTVDASDLPF